MKKPKLTTEQQKHFRKMLLYIEYVVFCLKRELCPEEKVLDVTAERDRLRAALELIVAWKDFPATGHFWPNADGSLSDREMPYGCCYGSNGERDYMRSIAAAALVLETPTSYHAAKEKDHT
jgi:hypothetical protein